MAKSSLMDSEGKHKTTTQNLVQFVERFRNPPAHYRTMPQWSWNGDIDRRRISEVLEQFKDRGCGGVFMHARPGIMVEYLSKRWFELWTWGMREAARLGLEWQIYDEFTVAGGNAGGYTVIESPHAAQHEVSVLPLADLSEIAGNRDVLAVYRVPIGRPGALAIDLTAPNTASPEIPDGRRLLALAYKSGGKR